MKRSPLKRKSPLKQGDKPLKRTEFRSKRKAPKPRSKLKPVSEKRARENRERREVKKQMVAERGDRCQWPEGCPREAVDAHEVKKRSRGGSITDPENIVLLCREHHDFTEAEPEKAAAMGLLRHSWE